LRLLLISQYFPPEVTAASARVHAFAAGLAERGHEVEVICEVPNHPTGRVRDGFRRRPLVRRRMDGFGVRYLWVHAAEHKSPLSRTLTYGSFAALTTVTGSLAARPDAVLVSSPPLPAAIAASLIAGRHRVPWVFDVRDLWPEAAVTLGELRPGPATRALERIERRLYRRADAILAVTEPFRRQIAASVDDPEKVEVLSNGTTSEWLAAGRAEVDKAEVGLPDDRYVWTYAGNLGLAQGLETAIDAAALLGEAFHLELVGDGPRISGLRQRAERSGGAQVSFRGLVEPPIAARIMRASDAVLVSLAARPELVKSVPSKLFDCCAVGRPVIVAASGEPRRLALDAAAAVAVEPGDPASLADAIRTLRGDPARAEELSRAGRDFARAHLRENQVAELERVLLGLAGD
jgi:glycosyltransferase involved in cell wall biosynthesis